MVKRGTRSSSTAKAKRSKTNDGIQRLHTSCVGEESVASRLAAVEEHQETLAEVVWSTLKADDPSSTTFLQACDLLVVWVVFQHAHLLKSAAQILEMVDDDDTVWLAALEVIGRTAAALRTPVTVREYDRLADLARFYSLVWSVAQDKPAWRQSALMRPLGAELSLWRSIAERQRDLLLRQFGLLEEYKSAAEQDDPLLIVQLVRSVLSLVQSEAFVIGKKPLRNPVAEVTEQDLEDKQEEEEQNEDAVEDAEEDADAQELRLHQWVFVHRVLELLIDLLSAPETRRYLTSYLTSVHFAIECESALGRPSAISYQQVDENWFLTQQLLDSLKRLLQFAFDDATVQPLSPVDQLARYHQRATALQKMCHRYHAETLPDLIYAGVGLLVQPGNASFLRSALGGLEDEQLYALLAKMRLVCGKAQEFDMRRDYYLEILLEYLTMPDNPVKALQSIPLYPTESVLWDFSRIPPGLSALLPVSGVLALPKLSSMYLSFSDYLYRNFDLQRLESAYEIRSDLVDVVRRMRPLLRQSMDVDDNGNETTELRTEFAGWARMALELDGKVQLTKVAPALLGEAHPHAVTAEFTIELRPCGDALRQEWDELGEYDNLFLVTVDASQMTGEAAPLLSQYHLKHGNHRRWDSDEDRRVPDVDDRSFPKRYGVTLVRGCMVLQVRDEEGEVISEYGSKTGQGTKRTFRVAMDPAQFSLDRQSVAGTDIYQSFNLVVRRQGRENNFKAILETIRGLMAGSGSIGRVVPSWLQPLILGHGDPNSASYESESMQSLARKTAGVANPEDALDFGDTFVSEQHLFDSFPECTVAIDGRAKATSNVVRCNYRVRAFSKEGKRFIEATSYPIAEAARGNSVPFTPVQVEAIRSGLSNGLTMCVGPPGTGKTDVAVQIIACLFHSFPTQRTIVITHSNAALNDIFQKVMARGDVDERYLVRLGAGERDLETDSTHDFTKAGRVAFSLGRRGELLEEVQLLSESLGISGKAERGPDGSPSYTCETASYFNEHHIQKRIKDFDRNVEHLTEDADVASVFPFGSYFKHGEEPLSLSKARLLLLKLKNTFNELEEYRPLELLRSQRQKTDYLLMKQARVVAMTCTHAAIARSHLIELGFEYDNIVVEEAGQMTEIETFIPLLLQKGQSGESTTSRLKRICLLGDHNQLPPVIKNMSFAHYSSLDQSLFSRFIRADVTHIQLDKQGRARSEIACLYNWRYKNLGDLEHVVESDTYKLANPGFAQTFQLINVDNYQGKGETSPTAYFYQNIGEAEYAVALFQYMVLVGYSPQKISILTTYNGQKELLSDIIAQRCGEGTMLAGVRPRAVSTVDHYQGQQNDFVILSLVRTKSVGHLRDIRRLVVAVSRARLGLYVLCRQELFAGCHDLKLTFDQFTDRPNKLQLVLGETVPTERKVGEKVPKGKLFEVDDVEHLGSLVHQMQEEYLQSNEGGSS